MEQKEKTLREKYDELAKNSLIKVQYSCSGSTCGIDEQEDIPIVPENSNLKKLDNEDETKIFG